MTALLTTQVIPVQTRRFVIVSALTIASLRKPYRHEGSFVTFGSIPVLPFDFHWFGTKTCGGVRLILLRVDTTWPSFVETLENSTQHLFEWIFLLEMINSRMWDGISGCGPQPWIMQGKCNEGKYLLSKVSGWRGDEVLNTKTQQQTGNNDKLLETPKTARFQNRKCEIHQVTSSQGQKQGRKKHFGEKKDYFLWIFFSLLVLFNSFLGVLND